MHAADASVWVAAIAAVASVTTAVISLHVKRNQATGNGHTIGRGVSLIEDRMQEHENRLDRIEVRMVEDLSEIKQRLTSTMFDLERHAATYRHDRRLDE